MPSLSYSQLSTYRRCPKQYEYASIKKVPRRISDGESFGSSIHNTLKRWGELEMLCQAKAPLRHQLKLFAEHEHENVRQTPLELPTLLTMFRECFIAEGYENRAALDQALTQGEKLIRKFFVWWRKIQRTVLSVESSFKLTLEGEESKGSEPVLVSGRFDRIERTERGLWIIDYKTGDQRSQESVDSDLQLSIYALAAEREWNQPIDRLSLLFLNADGVSERSTTRSSSTLQDAIATIRLLNGGIEARDFTATPAKEKCAYCPYREFCPERI